jgi:APA family basic amino acid/polyamine antiporter
MGEHFSKIAQVEKESLKRVLGVADLFAIGYGDVGSSIYYALGITALFALGATPLALAMAGVVFVCTALTYAEMTSTFHESGGSASYARHAFNDLISFVAGWGLLLDYIVTIAISAFAVGPYLSYFFPELLVPGVQMSFTISLIGILFFLNFLGIRQSTRVSLLLAGMTLITQFLVILVGIRWLFDISWVLEHVRINVPGSDWSPTWPQFWKGTAMAMVAYTGIESIAQLGAESKHPSKTVPRAVTVTMVVLILVYLGISVVALSAISPHDLGTKYVQNPLSGIVAALPFGASILSPLVGVIAAALLLVASNAGLIGASRLAFNMGQYYQLPRFFQHTHARFRTPYISLAFFAILATGVVLSSNGVMMFLADLYNFGAMLAFFFAHLSLIVLRIKKPDLKRPFKIPINIRFLGGQVPITAIIGCLSTMAVWFLVVMTKPQGRYLGFAWMGFGILMYFLFRRKKRIAAAGHVSIEKIRMPEYKPLAIRHILVPTRGGVETETIQMACQLAKVHGAKLTAVTIIEVAPSIPLDTVLPHRTLLAEAVLKRVEAIAREFNVEVDLQIVRSRSIPETIIELSHGDKFDLLVLGSLKTKKESVKKGLGSISDKIVREAHCRVWVCTNTVRRDDH